ncbi:MAG: P-II family nitrogen regulator [Immundisolibacteraceae bacterium]|jgi:nitrogen regulatory protein PII|nr:P-II family nitrogen regulator [Immundisolibacteraceae bacterium]
MRFKMIVTLVEDDKTERILETAREYGATGATVINNARGEGIKKKSTFFGLSLDARRDAIVMLVEEHLARGVLEHIAEVGEFDTKPGTGIAFQLDVEDAVGVVHQMEELTHVVEDKI